ncbi:MAG: hypothetical protein ABMA64_03200 [Myxococcota bacterium]
MSAEDPIADNPYYVLELRPGATAAEIERAAQRLMAMLGVGIEAAGQYQTPIGARPRDTERVRRALDQLRDPERRWRHEVWARVPPDAAAAEPAVAGWPEALEALGVRRRQNR